MIRLLPASERLSRPWKNGGGVTYDIFTYPEGGAFDRFGWRVSMAEVAVNGPFSRFEGIDRSTAVLRGEGFRLDFSDGSHVDIQPNGLALRYPGDLDAQCTLAGGRVWDLNVMTRRSDFRHRLSRVVGRCAVTGTALVFCPSGLARIEVDGQMLSLFGGDAAFLETKRLWTLDADDPVWLVEIFPV